MSTQKNISSKIKSLTFLGVRGKGQIAHYLRNTPLVRKGDGRKIILYIFLLLCFQNSYSQVKTIDVEIDANMSKARQLIKGNQEDKQQALKLYEQCAKQGSARAWYALGTLYKLGVYLPVNYKKAYIYFNQSASMNYPLGLFYTGHMLYKGLGCTQNYSKACELFKKGSLLNDRNSMYMLGVSYRNGYGITPNKDSAKFWLLKSASLGCMWANEELAKPKPENNNASVDLIEKINAAKKQIAPKTNPLNKYTKIETSVSASDLEGMFKGYLLKYDWSGTYIIEVTPLTLQLNCSNQNITGIWQEGDSSRLQIHAMLTQKEGLVFDSMQYHRTDHFYTKNPLNYIFKNASLQLIKVNDTNYLAGNLNLFVPMFKEPEKPFRIVLTQIIKGTNHSNIDFTNADGSPIKQAEQLIAYPNPFTSVINIDFKLSKTQQVYTQVITYDGKVVYTTPAATLQSGSYTLPLKPSIPNGAYIIRLCHGKQVQIAKVIKQ